MNASYCRYILRFINPATTSRNTMLEKETFFIKIWDRNPDIYGIGECAIFRGLSAEDTPYYEDKIRELCQNINNGNSTDLKDLSSIKFGLETALNDYNNGGQRTIFRNKWRDGMSEIPINGLIWMGNKDEMYSRIKEKLSLGFRCLKLKIGGIDFNNELDLIKYIRSKFSSDKLELRLDANGAFSEIDAENKLKLLSTYDIHSIEQPIKPKNWKFMSYLCNISPIDIALDEELIGINNTEEKRKMLQAVKPHYIILKPSLCGGFSGADEWINIAKNSGIKWWATSALESNVGLNAIAQWVATYNNELPQGLGTGALYHNNISSPIIQERDILRYDRMGHWDFSSITWK